MSVDDLSRRRILAREPIPIEESKRGWTKFMRCPDRDHKIEWSFANRCAFYVSFAHHKIVRLPTMGAAA